MKKHPNDLPSHCQNLIVLGGTFDPIHLGHLAIAEAAYNQFKLQHILFIPASQPAHKQGRQIACTTHRYNMTVLAIREYPQFDISRLEVDRPGPSYTIDTARALQAIYPPGIKISFLIGADALEGILAWKDIAELMSICEFIVVPRPGYNKGPMEHIAHLTDTYNAQISWINGPQIDISSTDIRNRISAGQSIQGLVPKTVLEYASKHELYGAKIHHAPTTGNFQFEAAKDALRIRLSPELFTHTMGTVNEAEKLATLYGQDVQKARTAALLHDCAKEYSADKKRALCQIWGVQLDAVQEAGIDALAHSLLGAESARRDFHVHDPEILQAIRYHTTGHANMTMLDKIINLADYIEPNRGNWGPINEMRKLALTNINQALILGLEYTIKKCEENSRPLHSWTRDALKELLNSRANSASPQRSEEA